MHPRHTPLLLLVFSLLSTSAFAQSQAPKPCSLTLAASVLQKGRLATVTGLTKSSFSLSAGKIHKFPLSSELVQAKRVILLLDISGSMRQPWPTASRIVRELLSEIPSATDVVAYAFREELYKIGTKDDMLQFLHDTDKDLEKRVKGKTRFYDLLNKVMLVENADRETAIAIISDGANNAGSINQKQIEQEFTRRSTRLMLVIVRSADSPATAEEEHDMTLLPYLIDKTGAISILVPGVARGTARALPVETADALLNSYRLEFDDPMLADQTFHLDVVGPDAKKLKNAEVHRVARMPVCR